MGGAHGWYSCSSEDSDEEQLLEREPSASSLVRESAMTGTEVWKNEVNMEMCEPVPHNGL